MRETSPSKSGPGVRRGGRAGLVVTACGWVYLAACLLAGNATAAAADSTVPPAPSSEAARSEARRLVREGAALFDAGKYAAALDKFQVAYARFPNPKIRFNIAQAYRKLRQPVQSTVEFEAFLHSVDQPVPADRQEAEAAIREMAAAVARLELAADPAGAGVRVDGVPAGVTPLRQPLVLAPGEHQIEIELSGYQTVRESIALRGGQKKRIERRLLAVPPPAPPLAATPPVVPLPVPGAGPAEAPQLLAPAPDSHPDSSKQRTVGKVLLGGSLAFATGAVVLLAASWSKNNNAQDDCTSNCGAIADDIDALALWSKLLFGATAVSAGAGATLLLGPPGLFGASPGGASAPASIAVAGKF